MDKNQQFLEQVGVLVECSQKNLQEIAYYQKQLDIRSRQVQIQQQRIEQLEAINDQVIAENTKYKNFNVKETAEFQELQDRYQQLVERLSEYDNVFNLMNAELDNRKQKVIMLNQQNVDLIKENQIIKTSLEFNQNNNVEKNSKLVQTDTTNDSVDETGQSSAQGNAFIHSANIFSQLEQAARGIAPNTYSESKINISQEASDQGAAQQSGFNALFNTDNVVFARDPIELIPDPAASRTAAGSLAANTLEKHSTRSMAQSPAKSGDGNHASAQQLTRYSEAVRSQVTIEQSNAKYDEAQNMLINISTTSQESQRKRKLNRQHGDRQPQAGSESDARQSGERPGAAVAQTPSAHQDHSEKPQTPFILKEPQVKLSDEDVAKSDQNSQQFQTLEKYYAEVATMGGKVQADAPGPTGGLDQAKQTNADGGGSRQPKEGVQGGNFQFDDFQW